MKPTLREIGEVLKSEDAKTDKHFYGQVQKVNRDGDGKVVSYEVSLGGTSDVITCRKLAGAKLGDTVMVTLLSSGIAVVTSTLGGDSDAADAIQMAENLEVSKASIEELTATEARISDLEADHVSVSDLEATNANIQTLDAEKADVTFANIDFADIDIAKIGELFSESGIITNLTTETGTITGRLAGVTILGDLIEGNTIKADKLVVLGSDGLYYKLNVSGETVEAQQTDYNSINGSHIQAQSITASKISVSDLVAFHADIAGLRMDDGKIYSVGKSTVDSAAAGIYMDSDGQFNTGDSRNFIASWYDTAEEKWKVAIRADQITLGGGESIEQVVTNAAEAAATPVLRIDSSRGTVFKNNQVSTVLTVSIFVSGQRITNQQALQARFGAGAYLQWYWQRLDDADFGIIVSTDHKLSNDGFSLTLTPEEVDTKVTFMCELITS